MDVQAVLGSAGVSAVDSDSLTSTDLGSVLSAESPAELQPPKVWRALRSSRLGVSALVLTACL